MNPEWRYAVDCVTGGRVSALSEAAAIDPDLIFQALDYGLSYSRHNDRKASGHITTAEARAVMAAWDSRGPPDAGGSLLAFMQPMSVKPDRQALHWPINRGRIQSCEAATWGLIAGIERGWFRYDRAGYLQWSPAGRDRYAAGSSGVVVNSATGQAAFAF